MKFEEVLPALRDGKEIRRASWENKDCVIIIDYLKNSYPHSLYLIDIFADDWEVFEEPEPDWEYIIKHKCLCWFWDSNFNWAMCGTLGQIEKGVEYEFTMFDEAGNRSAFKHCRPVRKEEVTFYEDRNENT